MIKYVLPFLLLASCDSASVDGPPGLPAMRMDSVRFFLLIANTYEGDYIVRYPGKDSLRFNITSMDSIKTAWGIDTTMEASLGDTVGVGFDVELTLGQSACINYILTHVGEEKPLLEMDQVCTQGEKENFYFQTAID